MKRLILALLILVVIAAGVLIFLNDTNDKIEEEIKTAVVPEATPFADPSYSPKALFDLPSYKMVDGKGEVFGSDDLAGQAYFIFTFSGNCDEPCSSYLTALKSAKNAMEQNFNTWNELAYVAINTDESITQEGLTEFAEKNDLEDSWYMLRTWTDFPQSALPADYNAEQEVLLVDREGQVRGRFNLSDEGVEEKIIQITRRVLRDPHKRIADPLEIINPEWLDKRMVAQLKKRDRIQSFVDFSFEDMVQESQITWRHQVADDAGKTYKPSHYDHGNGILTADVDGDQLLDLYFISQIGENQLWKNMGAGKFQNITAKSGLALRDLVCVSGSFADIDNDGDQDLFVTSILGGNKLFENNGKGNFKDISKASGLDYKGHSAGASFFDYDKDGLLDLFVSNVGKFTTGKTSTMEVKHPSEPLQDGSYEFPEAMKDAFFGHLFPDRKEQSILYHNEGGNRFKNVSAEMNLQDTSWTGDSHPMDLNGDGWTDLYLTNMQGDDQYYENVEGKSFVKKSREVFPKTPWGAMSIGVSDFDSDQDLDVFISDMHSDMAQDFTYWDEKKKNPVNFPPKFLVNSDGIYGNAFFKNGGDMKFEDVSMQNGAENLWPWGMTVGDVNADGFEDVFVASSMNYPFRYAVNSMLINEGGKFADAEFILGLEPRKNNQTATWWFNYTDENTEVVEKWGEQEVWAALGTRSSVFLDLDDDGDLDIVTSEFNSAPMVMMSNLSEKKSDLNFVKIQLEGTSSNRNGFGAVVKVNSGGKTIMRHNHGKSGYLSQSVAPLYIGLGSSNTVDSIEVIWPSGKTQKLTQGIALNGTTRIIEE